MNAETLRARFDAPDELGIGIEEELFLLDPETLDLLPNAREVLERSAATRGSSASCPRRSSRSSLRRPRRATAVAALAAARSDLVAAAEPSAA